MLNVAILDDNTQFAERLAQHLSRDHRFETPKQFTDPHKAIAYAKRSNLDAFLVDFNLRNDNGIRWIHRLREGKPNTRVLACTEAALEHTIITALEAGAFGYILKSDTADNIADSIADAVAGQPVVSKPVLKIIFRYIQKNTTHEGRYSISKAELRVMRLTKLGYDCKTIAEKLAISVQTVYVHNRRIFRKLGVNNRMAAVARLADLDLDSQAVFSE